MRKILEIEGMTCGHCQKRVEEALVGIPAVSAKVDYRKNMAVIKMKDEVADEVIRKAVEDAGYRVITIRILKSLF